MALAELLRERGPVGLAPARRRVPPTPGGGRRRAAVAALVGLVGVGVGLRLWSFSPLWLDEAQSVYFAKLPLSHLHAGLRTDGAPPLYYVALHGWIAMFGDGSWTVRSLSMLASIAALPSVWLVARRLGADRRQAAITLVVLADNPWAVRYAGEARMYSFVVLEVLLGILALLRLRRVGDRAALAAVAVLSAALLYTHYWAVFLLSTLLVGLLVLAWRFPGERRFVLRTVAALVLGGLGYLPWVPTMLYQSAHTGAPWAPPPTLNTLAGLPTEWFGGGGPSGQCAVLVAIPLLALGAFVRAGSGGWIRVGLRPLDAAGALALITAGTLALGIAVSVLEGSAVAPRYTAVVVPLVVLLLGFGLSRLPRRAGTAGLSVLLALGLAASVVMVRAPHSHGSEIAADLNARARPGDLLLFCPDQLAPAVERTLRVPGVRQQTLPSEADPAVVNWVDYRARTTAINTRTVATGLEKFVRSVPHASLWFVFSRGYWTTHSSICGPLNTRLIGALGVPHSWRSFAGAGHEGAAVEQFRR
jgi:hypothetical protein